MNAPVHFLTFFRHPHARFACRTTLESLPGPGPYLPRNGTTTTGGEAFAGLDEVTCPDCKAKVEQMDRDYEANHGW